MSGFAGPHYTSSTLWTPRHYGDELAEHAPDASAELAIVGATDRSSYGALAATRTTCPVCGRHRPAAALVDVRHFPSAVSQGADWLCDACWQTWVRPSGLRGRTPIVQRLSEAEWVALHGAPRALVQHFVGLVAAQQVRGWQTAHRIAKVVDVTKAASVIPVAARLPKDLPWNPSPQLVAAVPAVLPGIVT